MINQIVELLEKKDRPYLSSIIYFICGIIMIIVSFIQVLPIKINIDYFNKIDFEAKLDDNSYIVILTLVLLILYVIMFVIRRVAIHFSNKLSDEIFNNRCVILYSVEDTIDLITSITSLVVSENDAPRLRNTSLNIGSTLSTKSSTTAPITTIIIDG